MSKSELEKVGMQAIRKNYRGREKINVSIEILKLMGEDYIANDLSINQIAEKYNVVYTTVQSVAQVGKWSKKRQEFREKMVTQTVKDCEIKYKRIASDIGELFFKQSQYIKRRLRLLKDGEPVPPQLMKQALKLHEVVSRDLLKVKDIDKKLVPSKITAVAEGMPSVIDMLEYQPEDKKPILKKPSIEVEVSAIDTEEESK